MKIACVIHRYGADIAGGSEGHCRLISEHLAAAHDVTIVTTTARDHVTWSSHYPAGESRVGPVRVLRFPVDRPRDLHRFRDISDRVFSERATAEEEEQWFRENGPQAPALLEFLERHGREFDLVLFWSYRYYDAYFGVRLVADRAVLVPTAEEDPLIHIAALAPFFRLPRGYLFLTPEEEALVGDRVPAATPRQIIGCGIDPPPPVDASRLASLGIVKPYVLYLGRIDPNKGCDTLIRHFLRYAEQPDPIQLVMAGPANMPVPDHPLVRVLGLVDEPTRDALLAGARVLMMPSPYESLSMVLLEAWNHGTPALVNARCAVLKGQVLRADGGLFYQTAMEFAAALQYLLAHPDVARQLGAQGRAYVEQEYRWPAVTGKIERLLVMASARRA
ncbi:MAG TPA: glycosyltransferase family 4 protein [Vicinamibacterales bacterium]|jgi:glycosyltransferase involved in cell wall biosynthesis|nr:glycosyltransferase family 4 protein [Vicinamibacterales bacterium]